MRVSRLVRTKKFNCGAALARLFPKTQTAACRAGACLFVAANLSVQADEVDDFIAAQMRDHRIVGLSLAVIDGGGIVKAKGYGLTDKGGKTPVNTETLFQAGSVSKSVAAIGALRLVERGRLSLDEDVNVKLRTWKVPENEFTKDEKVTLRRILSHSAGLTVHGFPGYGVGRPLPTLVQVLDGQKPANTAPIRVDMVPGSKWRYSGGGYTVMQQLVIDVTGQPFAEFMQQTVLSPLGMAHSTYQQPLPEDKAAETATGYTQKGEAVVGRWHIYPEMAAAGLWTTASDLARFCIAVQQSLGDKSHSVISTSMTRQMLATQKGDDGLGVFISGSGRTLQFSHGGRDDGFDTLMKATAETGKGAVIMINANDDSNASTKIAKEVARIYHWGGSD
jgi:CubicO group peptidase (beta-lactamase class C family)